MRHSLADALACVAAVRSFNNKSSKVSSFGEQCFVQFLVWTMPCLQINAWQSHLLYSLPIKLMT